MSNPTATVDHQAGGRQAPRHVGVGRLRRSSPPNSSRRSAPCWWRPPASGPGDRVLDVAAGTGNAAIPAAADRGERRRQRPVPGAARAGQPAGRRARRRPRMARGRRPGIAVRRRRIRRGDVVHRRDVRAVPPAGRRRAGPGVQTGRQDRPDQLDARGPHRPAVRDDEAVRSCPAAGCAAAAAVGSRGSRPRAARRPRHRRRHASDAR